jgi:hypothetical protein
MFPSKLNGPLGPDGGALSALGGPMGSLGEPLLVGVPRSGVQRRAIEPEDADASDATTLQLLGHEEMAVHLY